MATEAVAAAEQTIGEPSSADVIAFLPAPAADAAVAREVESIVTVRAKPEKRLNAKERARAKLKNSSAKDGTTPDTTAKTKSKADTKTNKAKKKAKELKKGKSAAGKAA